MNKLILLGDSMIDNGTYVQTGEPDVPTQVRTALPNWDVEMRAVDGCMTSDVLKTLKKKALPDGAAVVISIGGNNALDQIGILADPTERTPGEILVRMGVIRETFRAGYAPILDQLANNKVLVMTIYNPQFGPGEADLQAPAESALSYFNDVIQQEALARGFSVLDMRALFNDRTDYANPIEPSAIGGAKIAARIAEWVAS